MGSFKPRGELPPQIDYAYVSAVHAALSVLDIKGTQVP